MLAKSACVVRRATIGFVCGFVVAFVGWYLDNTSLVFCLFGLRMTTSVKRGSSMGSCHAAERRGVDLK